MNRKIKILIIVAIVAVVGYFWYTGRLQGIVSAKSDPTLPPEERIYQLSNYIKNDPAAAAWKQHIQEKAIANNISFNTQLRLDVIYALQQGGE